MAGKISLATTWLQGCSGCHMSLLDLHEGLGDLIDLVDIAYSPIVDAKQVPHVKVGLIEGAVSNDENESVLKEFREKADILVAFGTCACSGGITGLRNLVSREAVLQCGYIDTPTTVDGRIPSDPVLPKLNPDVKAINQVVDVEYYIPGCPPLATNIKDAMLAVIEGRQVEQKTRNLCEACGRTKEKLLKAQRDFLSDEVLSVHELDHIDSQQCFLEQGVLCMGPATREGCGAMCPSANMPCRGCQGPPHGIYDQGAKLINCLSSILPAGGMMFQEDIVGVGYCHSMPVSTLSTIASQKGAGSNE